MHVLIIPNKEIINCVINSGMSIVLKERKKIAQSFMQINFIMTYKIIYYHIYNLVFLCTDFFLIKEIGVSTGLMKIKTNC